MPAEIQKSVVRFSIRELLFVVAGISCTLGGWSLYGILGASTITLILGALLAVNGRRATKPWHTRLGVVLAILSFCVLCLAFAIGTLFGVGPIYTRAAWPREFRQMALAANSNPGDVKIEGLGSFIDSAYAWRISVSPDRLQPILSNYSLKSIAAESVPSSFWRAFPLRWRPSQNANSRYYSTLNFPARSRGNDGEHYFVMYDSRDERLYVWYKYNF